ncbi:MAG: hypothetical protein ACE5IY_22625 [bacterium]
MRKLKPGEPGTKKLLEQYGDNLVCVRYRNDRQRNIKTKTVELIVESSPWVPPESLTHIRINYGEVALGKKVRAAGGKWNRARQLWELPYRNANKEWGWQYVFPASKLSKDPRSDAV